MIIALFIGGLICLIIGAEALVRGSSKIAGYLGMAPLVIGLTVVAFGTSSPELAVSIKSALAGQGNIAVGNVVGSNIFNVLFILGISAILIPLTVEQKLVKLEIPLMIGISVLTWLFVLDRILSNVEGAILFMGLIAYLWFLIRQTRRENALLKQQQSENSELSPSAGKWILNSILVVGGLGLLVLGSRWFVDGAVIMARNLGVSELVIGLTIVAAGTSLPEVVTSVIAALKGERDIAVGNVVGSNIFNLLCVLGLSGVVANGGIPVSDAAIRFDIPVMIGVALICLPVFFTGKKVSRAEGVLLFGLYFSYTFWLIFSS
jgi:cation:H+ antiporter